MVDAASGTGRRKGWEFHEEPPAPPVTTSGRPTLVGWGHAPPMPVYRHPLLPDFSPIAALKQAGSHAAITRAHESFPDTASLAGEVMRLKKELAAPGHDDATRAALQRQIAFRQSEWVGKAKAAGMHEPTGPVDPFRSSPAEIENAFLWSAVGGVIPREELARDGGVAFGTSVRDAVVLRTRGFDAVLVLHRGCPDEQRALLQKELAMRNVVPPGDANLETLRALYAESVRNERARRKQIGVDGRVGTADEVDRYDRQQAIDAMNPGSTLGSMMATYSTIINGEVDVDRMRQMGETGNAAEGVLGSTGSPVDP
jgi:hypothetical protein